MDTGPCLAATAFDTANMVRPPRIAAATITTGTSTENAPLPVLNSSRPLAISEAMPPTANTAWPPIFNSSTNSTIATTNSSTPTAFTGSWAVP